MGYAWVTNGSVGYGLGQTIADVGKEGRARQGRGGQAYAASGGMTGRGGGVQYEGRS